jgi:hypothetical protein
MICEDRMIKCESRRRAASIGAEEAEVERGVRSEVAGHRNPGAGGAIDNGDAEIV